MELAAARVLVAGGGSGIGRVLAREAARRGAAVTIWDMSADRGEALRDEILSSGGRARSMVVDVTDPVLVQEAAVHVGEVDVLITIAGIVAAPNLRSAPGRGYHLSTLSLCWIARSFLPGMVARNRGAIVTVASAPGFRGQPRRAEDEAAELTSIGFTASFRAAHPESRVSFMTVCPRGVRPSGSDAPAARLPVLLPPPASRNVAATVFGAIARDRSTVIVPWAVLALSPVRWRGAWLNGAAPALARLVRQARTAPQWRRGISG